MKKIDLAELQMAATKKICSGELTENDLLNFINAENADPNRVVCCIDVYADGKVRKHTTTEDEVIDFVSRCEDFEQLMVTMATKRQEYQGQVERAKIAREKKQQQKEG